jgi:hypothetical protein
VVVGGEPEVSCLSAMATAMQVETKAVEITGGREDRAGDPY